MISGRAFGTSYHIKCFADANNKSTLEEGIMTIIQSVDASMSTYLSTSKLARINAGDTTVFIDTMLKEVFVLSKKIHKSTNGYFDPTIGGLRNAYGFGDTQAMNQISAAQ